MRMAKLYVSVFGIAASAVLLNCCIPVREATCADGKQCTPVGSGDPPEDGPPPDPPPPDCVKQSTCLDTACSADFVGQPKCMSATELVYVRIPKDATEQGLCAGATGSHDSPFCTLSDALTKVQGTSLHIRLLPLASSTMTFGALDLAATDMGSTGTIFIHGSYDPGAIGSPAELTSVKVSGGRALTLSDVHLGQSSSDAATCVNGGFLTIIRSRIAAATGLGINATNCANLTVDRVYIEGNTGGAIKLSGTASHAISNSYIVGNGNVARAEPAVSIDNSAGVFEANTIAKNISTASTPGGIGCSSRGEPTRLRNSIVLLNTMSSSPTQSQFQNGSSCIFEQTVVVGTVDTRSAPAVVHKDAVFMDVNAGNFKLDPTKPENVACCINTAGPTALQRRSDFWGFPRPMDKPDVGAEEVP